MVQRARLKIRDPGRSPEESGHSHNGGHPSWYRQIQQASHLKCAENPEMDNSSYRFLNTWGRNWTNHEGEKTFRSQEICGKRRKALHLRVSGTVVTTHILTLLYELNRISYLQTFIHKSVHIYSLYLNQCMTI